MGLSWASRHVVGEAELYVVMDVEGFEDHQVEVYIYADEAGFFVDRGWTILESQDFSESQQLQDEFVAVLGRRLRSLLSDED